MLTHCDPLLPYTAQINKGTARVTSKITFLLMSLCKFATKQINSFLVFCEGASNDTVLCGIIAENYAFKGSEYLSALGTFTADRL